MSFAVAEREVRHRKKEFQKRIDDHATRHHEWQLNAEETRGV